MGSGLLRVVLVWLVLVLPGAAPALERKVYVFGNSLVHHLSEGPETAVPWWLARMAREAGHGFAADGQWGFLRDFAAPGGPVPNWSIEGVKSVWAPGQGDFAVAGWDAVVVTPANFIQARAPDAPYEGDNPGGASPLSALLAVVDASGEAPVLVYEGWAEMAGRFPPGERALAAYHALNRGEYHDWYVELVARLKAERPGRRIALIPVASVLAGLFAEGPLKGLPAEALYVDADPHGTPTLYLLAAMVTWTALYGEPAPGTMELPEGIDGAVARAYPLLAVSIAAQLKGMGFAAAETAPEPTAAGAAEPQVQVAVAEGPAEGLADPALAMGLNGIADWSTQQPFVDIMKTARPWLGHAGEQWGAWDVARLGREGYLDAEGWVTRFPPGVDRIESFVLTDQDEAASAMAALYRVRWQGQGKLTVGGRAREVRRDEGELWFRYAPGEGEVAVTLHETDPQDPIRGIEILREDQIALHELGVVFNPDWVTRIADLRGLRFMDWMLTNGSPVTSWEGRPGLGDFSYGWRGVPVEAMIELANLVGADPWFCMPHGADDGYVEEFARLVHERLDPRLRVHVEFSNELWNFVFPQARWAAEAARARWGDKAGDEGWMRAAGARAGEVMRIWAGVFAGEDARRLVRVAAVHTGWPGLEAAFFEGAGEGAAFDAYAVSGYFGFELGDAEEGRLGELRGWIAESRAAAEEAARAQGLKWRALRVAVEPVVFDRAIPKAAAAVRAGSMAELTGVLWPYHAKAARERGLRLIMYEGGSHAVGHGAAVEDEDLAAFFAAFSYGPEMAGLYQAALEAWRALGGGPFNAFVDVARGSRHGNWGALRHLQDDNPRWQALMAANAGGSGETGRDPGAFLHGVVRRGGDGADALEGTVEEDILLGGAGDDLLDARGGGDFLDGGPGQDVARLAGARADYAFAIEGARLLALRGGEATRLRGVEMLEFAGEPGRQYRIELPE